MGVCGRGPSKLFQIDWGSGVQGNVPRVIITQQNYL